MTDAANKGREGDASLLKASDAAKGPQETSFRSGGSGRSKRSKRSGAQKSDVTDWIFPLDVKRDDSSFGKELSDSRLKEISMGRRMSRSRHLSTYSA